MTWTRREALAVGAGGLLGLLARGDELYVGFSRASSQSSAGTSPGFTYESPAADNLYIYDSSVSSSVSPTATQEGGRSITTGALIAAS